MEGTRFKITKHWRSTDGYVDLTFLHAVVIDNFKHEKIRTFTSLKEAEILQAGLEKVYAAQLLDEMIDNGLIPQNTDLDIAPIKEYT